MKELPTAITDIASRFCQDLPGSTTIFEHNGFCKITNPDCIYAEKLSGHEDGKPICKKKTFTPLQEQKITT